MTAHIDMFRRSGDLACARFRLAEGNALVAIGGQSALFSQPEEKLYALDGLTAVAAAQLAQETSFVTLAEALDKAGASGRRYARALLRQWSALGLVEADAGSPRPEPMGRQTIRIASVAAELTCSSAALHQRISPVFGHLAAPADGTEVRFDLVESDGLILVSRDGGGAAIVSAREAGPLLKGLLIKEVLAAAPPEIALHAACLVAGGRALLLTGTPGTGKSTLTMALASRGFGFAADDISLLAPDGQVRGVPFAPAVKAGAWSLLRAMHPDLDAQPIHLRLDRLRVRYLPPRAPHEERLPVGWIVHLCRTEGAKAALVPLTPVQALARLMHEAYSARGPADLETLRTMIGVAEHARAFDLAYSDLDDAVHILTGACADA